MLISSRTVLNLDYNDLQIGRQRCFRYNIAHGGF